MSRPVLLVVLTIIWLVLWRDLSWANVLSGAIVAAVVTTLYPLARSRDHRHTLRPLPWVIFHAYFAWQLLVSNFVVAREILTPRDRIRSGIVAVPVSGCSDLLITIVANAISLTPGTVTLLVRRDPPTLYVHVMHLYDIDRVRRNINHLERLAIRAYGSQEALAQLDAEEASS